MKKNSLKTNQVSFIHSFILSELFYLPLHRVH